MYGWPLKTWTGQYWGEVLSINFIETALTGVFEIVPGYVENEHSLNMEVFRKRAFEERGLPTDWVQCNQILSRKKGALRGLHYQRPPLAQAKLIRVVTGTIFDVAVDVRQGSPSCASWTGLVISAEKGNQLLIPTGFAHGFLTLQPNTKVIIKATAPYSGEYDRAIHYNDPEIGIDWPLDGETPILSTKDAGAKLLKEQDTGFAYSGNDARQGGEYAGSRPAD
ncbi:MAG: dTDP-4-dehydrorhamnose 3,5-epimerase [Nitratireductor sp.]|nr:dTDP-4-dehydrorhamnose 3,5-epimerase [Nitratireductor sp.]